MAEKVNKKSFKVEEKEYAVLRPNHRVVQQGQLAYARAFREATEAGVPVHAKIERVMQEQNIWDESKKKEFERLAKSLLDGERKLAMGAASGLTKAKSRDLAIQMRKDRNDLRLLNSERHQLAQNTAEAYAEQARFNFLVSACTVYGDTGERYFTDVEDYLLKSEDDKVAFEAASELSKIVYPLDDEWAKKLPENKFLLKYRFADEKLRLIDAEGRLIDDEGRLVNDKGQWVNEAGEPVDRDGNALTDKGEYKVEFVEFAD